MLQRRRNAFVSGIIATVLAALLTGCGASTGSSPTNAGSATGTLAPISQATATPTQEPMPPPKSQPCPDSLRTEPGSVHIGDMVLSVAFASPDGNYNQLPDNTPLKPLKLAIPGPTGPQPDPSWPHTILTATTVYAYICNASTTQTHTISKIHMKITAFTPYTAHLNAWDFCSGTYARPAGVTQQNCDRPGFSSDIALQSTFTTTAAGTVVDATGNYPLSFPPNTLHTVGVTFTVPSTPGAYTFSLNADTDAGTLPYSDSTWPLLNAPIAHMWGGPECNTATMLAQIPSATNPPTPYICPQS